MREGTITAEEYQKLKDVDIREIDPATAADIRGITVNPDLPPAERLLDVARQMNGNPFVYRCGDLLVKTSFAGTASLQSVLENMNAPVSRRRTPKQAGAGLPGSDIP